MGAQSSSDENRDDNKMWHWISTKTIFQIFFAGALISFIPGVIIGIFHQAILAWFYYWTITQMPWFWFMVLSPPIAILVIRYRLKQRKRRYMQRLNQKLSQPQ